MFGLGLVTSILSSSGPSKAEKKEAELKERGAQDQRDAADRQLDQRKREYANENGDASPEANQPKKSVCQFMKPLPSVLGITCGR